MENIYPECPPTDSRDPTSGCSVAARLGLLDVVGKAYRFSVKDMLKSSVPTIIYW
jgi:hypothetical protein